MLQRKAFIILFWTLLWVSTTGIWQQTQAQTSAKRWVLLEHVTNTYCPSCANNNPNVYNNILTPYEDVDVFHIAYHVSYPSSNDIFYQAASAEINTRNTYYNPPGTPSMYVQGTFNDNGSPLLTNAQLQPYLAQTSPIAVSVTETTSGTQRNVSITIQTLGTPPSGNLKLRTAVVEKSITYTAPNLETQHRNIFRQTLNGWNTSFTPASSGNSVTINYSYTLQATWNAPQIYVIAWIQNDTNKEILNAGSSWIPQIPSAKAKITCRLQGAFNTSTTSMNTTLRSNNLLPTQQPFNVAPWNYIGTENSTNLPSDVVDWVLVEARSASNATTVLARKAALLLSNGALRDAESNGATDGVTFTGIAAGNYYVAIKPRNHLAVMSANALALPNSTALDLTQTINVMGGTMQLANLGSNRYALFVGDHNANGLITVQDYNGYATDIGVNHYKRGDFNLNGNTTVADFNAMQPNISKMAISYLRY